MEEAWDSEYDSTWQGEEEEEERQRRRQERTKGTRNKNYSQTRAARDLQDYRHGYPRRISEDLWNYGYSRADEMPNLLFYQNKIAFEPNGVTIEELHEEWKDDYEELERNHNFIQWLFPLREPGLNGRATPLTLLEIQAMKNDTEVMRRLLSSYKLMLGFYGILLLEERTGEVGRAENWRDRFDNLNYNYHNNLRITRILKCLGEMGFECFQAPLVRFFLIEILCKGELPGVKNSALDYFIFTVKNKEERKKLVLLAWKYYEPKGKFRWGPVRKLSQLEPPVTLESSQRNEDDIEHYVPEQEGRASLVAQRLFTCLGIFLYPCFVSLRCLSWPVYAGLWFLLRPFVLCSRICFHPFWPFLYPVFRRLRAPFCWLWRAGAKSGSKDRRRGIGKIHPQSGKHNLLEKGEGGQHLLDDDANIGENSILVKRKNNSGEMARKHRMAENQNHSTEGAKHGGKSQERDLKEKILRSMSSAIQTERESQDSIRLSNKEVGGVETLKDGDFGNRNFSTLNNLFSHTREKDRHDLISEGDLISHSTREGVFVAIPEDSMQEIQNVPGRNIEEDRRSEKPEDITQDIEQTKQNLQRQSTEEGLSIEIPEHVKSEPGKLIQQHEDIHDDISEDCKPEKDDESIARLEDMKETE